MYGLLRPEDTFGMLKSKKVWEDMCQCKAVVRNFALYNDTYPTALPKKDKKVVGYILSCSKFDLWNQRLALYDKTLGFDPNAKKPETNIY